MKAARLHIEIVARVGEDRGSQAGRSQGDRSGNQAQGPVCIPDVSEHDIEVKIPFLEDAGPGESGGSEDREIAGHERVKTTRNHHLPITNIATF